MTTDTTRCPHAEQLLAYAHGDTDRATAISAHLESCERCSRIVANTFSWLGDEQSEPTGPAGPLPRTLWQRIEERLRFRQKGGKVLHIGFSPFPVVSDESSPAAPVRMAAAGGHRGAHAALASALTLEDGTEIAISLRGGLLTLRASRDSHPLAGLRLEWAPEKEGDAVEKRTAVVTDRSGRARIRFPATDPVRLWISGDSAE